MRLLPLLLGFVLDLLFGDPEWLPHPVVLMGRFISAYERHLRPRFPQSPRGQFLCGLLLSALLPLGTFVLSSGALALAGRVHWGLRLALESFWSAQCLALRGLASESRKVYLALEGEDLPGARLAVGRIVGRETERLDAQGVTRAAVETVAENFSDGVAAPLLCLTLFGAPLALAYKAVNTLDSMIGYRSERYLYFGRAAAKSDDAANFLPSRVSALLWVLAAALTGQDGAGAFRIWRRDAGKHLSPNAGQTEAACAGALGITLGGDAWYFGQRYEKAVLGDPLRPPVPRDILLANRMLYAASFLLLLLCIPLRCALGS